MCRSPRGTHSHLPPTELHPQPPKPHAAPSPTGPLPGRQQAGAEVQVGEGEADGQGPCYLLGAPPTGHPEFKAWSGIVLASVLLPGFPCRDVAAQSNSDFTKLSHLSWAAWKMCWERPVKGLSRGRGLGSQGST